MENPKNPLPLLYNIYPNPSQKSQCSVKENNLVEYHAGSGTVPGLCCVVVVRTTVPLKG